MSHLADVHGPPDDGIIVGGDAFFDRVKEGPGVGMVPEVLEHFVHARPQVFVSLQNPKEPLKKNIENRTKKRVTEDCED